MGVWIETAYRTARHDDNRVTPCMGVWIETFLFISNLRKITVTPCMGVWIETTTRYLLPACQQSHPVWVCGLKPNAYINLCVDMESHPVWVCGLKQTKHRVDWCGYYVTPCMGVWIETRRLWLHIFPFRVTPCMGVWIETSPGWQKLSPCFVTPCMGVWIETRTLRRFRLGV